jgi:hypothetical protein
LIEELERVRSIGRTISKWEDNIKVDNKRIVHENIDSINMPQDRVEWRSLVNTAMNLPFP